MPVLVHAAGRPELPPLLMPDRFRHDVTYFCTPPGDAGVPQDLGKLEYWVRAEDARRVYDDGAIRIVSPLDSAFSTELEITEEQETWLEWMIDNRIERIRLESRRET